MTTNERQYQISKAQVARFRAAIDAPHSNTRALHPRAHASRAWSMTNARQWTGVSNSSPMTDNDMPYSRSLAPLESLLAGVKRPGGFCVHGALALPMPMVEVDGIGLLSFPLPQAQIAALVAAAERAPYGRGEQTVVDTSVRRVWQVDAARVRISGKSWAQSLGRILAETGRGLGCENAAIQAELYKLLVYDPGGFFLAHRDSETRSPTRVGFWFPRCKPCALRKSKAGSIRTRNACGCGAIAAPSCWHAASLPPRCRATGASRPSWTAGARIARRCRPSR
jgi:hypothetical protein